jgi:transcriptional regulator with XRE-family HTH domain
LTGKKGSEKMGYTYDKLRGRIIEKYGSQEKYADVLGISTNSLSKKMTGKTGFSQKDITIWADLLNIDKAEYGEYFFN